MPIRLPSKCLCLWLPVSINVSFDQSGSYYRDSQPVQVQVLRRSVWWVLSHKGEPIAFVLRWRQGNTTKKKAGKGKSQRKGYVLFNTFWHGMASLPLYSQQLWLLYRDLQHFITDGGGTDEHSLLHEDLQAVNDSLGEHSWSTTSLWETKGS